MCLLGCLEQFWAADAVAVGWLWLYWCTGHRNGCSGWATVSPRLGTCLWQQQQWVTRKSLLHTREPREDIAPQLAAPSVQGTVLCMLYSTIAVTWEWFWPPQIPWKSYMESFHLVTKKVFSLVISRDIIVLLLLWKRANCCCSLTLFLPCYIPFAAAFSQALLLGLPRFRYGQGLVLVCSTNKISFTHADIKFYAISLISRIHVHFTACYYLSVTLWIVITFDVSWDCDDTSLLTANFIIPLFIPSLENREICGENTPSIYKTGCLVSSQSPNTTALPHWNFWQYNQHRNQMWRSVTIMFLVAILDT